MKTGIKPGVYRTWYVIISRPNRTLRLAENSPSHGCRDECEKQVKQFRG